MMVNTNHNPTDKLETFLESVYLRQPAELDTFLASLVIFFVQCPQKDKGC